MKLKLMLASMLVALSLVGCGTAEKDEAKTISDLKATKEFDFTNADSKVTVKLEGGIPGAGIDILGTIPEENKDPEVLRTGNFDENGKFETTIYGVSPEQKTFYARSRYITQSSAEIAIVGNEATFNFAEPATVTTKKAGKATKIIKNGFDCVSDYDSWGIPYSLVKTTLDSGLVKRLNAAFPEGKAIKNLGTGDIELIPGNIKNDYEVKITVVHEGAAYKNTLGYYTYSKGNEPKTVADIKDIKVVFPNYETGYLSNTGGNVLKPGDTITLPVKFSKDTFIGFVVLQDGWKQSQGKIDPNSVRFYTNAALNSDKLQHTTAYYDMTDNRTIVGIEDILGGGDKDYNDLMFMINTKVDPLPPYDELTESDVTENYGNRTLAFEDNWPAKGDFDFNDQVIKFDYQLISKHKIVTRHYPETGATEIIEEKTTLKTLTMKYTLKATGAGLESGFGIVLPIDSSMIANVSGQNFTKQWPISIGTNGVENGSRSGESVILLYDSCKNMLAGKFTSDFLNTQVGQPYYTPVERTLTITFKDNVDQSLLARTFPYNPFIYRSWERGREVHLKNQKPTSKALELLSNASLEDDYFGNVEDASNMNNIYYATKNAYLPWALEIEGDFAYPVEFADIQKAYPKFYNWVTSNGTLDKNWANVANGNSKYIYTK